MEERKQKEAEFHDLIRNKATLADPAQREYYTANRKFYSITRASRSYFEGWIRERCPGKRVLDFGCGDGEYALFAAQHHATAVGVDISPVSVENARSEARRRGLVDRCTFAVQDVEALEFPDGSFDLVCESGVLHHLDLDKAYAEMARVLKPGGQVICTETLVHNPLIHWYRKRTPHLRTEYEVQHILGVPQILKARDYFDSVDIKFFHLASLLAVPWRNTPVFKPLLLVLEVVDAALLSLPGIQRQAWIAVYVMSGLKHRAK